MPKQILKINQFHGGLNSNSDARDIADNELSGAVDLMVDELGKIRMMGGKATHGTIQAQSDSEINPGYGLFQFSHDRRDGHTAGAGTEVETDYMVFSDPDTQGTVDIYSNEDDTWGSPITGMTDNTSGLRADVFYAVDGALRVCDSDYGNSNVSKRYGYYSRTDFAGLDGENVINHWASTNQKIAAPTVTSYYRVDADPTAPGAGGISIRVNKEATSGGTWTTDFNLYYSYVYIDNQESRLKKLTYGGGSPSAGAGATNKLSFRIWINNSSDFADNIIGIRVYYKDWDLGIEKTTEDRFLLWDCNFAEGYRFEFSSGGFTALENDTDDDLVASIVDADNNVTYDNKFIVETYETINGYTDKLKSIFSDYKTAVVTNRMAYIGNIKMYNLDTTTEILGDAIIKSPVNKFDIFPSNRLLETSIRDGDSIVKLEAYADRLLIFKKNKLELLNISQEIEFLEDTFMYKGVLHPAATCKTDFGIAWVNKLGCYLYDGQKVNNLLEKKGRQTIKESDWATFAANEPMIGYIPKKRQLIVVDDITTDGVGATFLYDLVTQSWVRGTTGTFPNQNKTNFVTDWNGDLVCAHTSDTGTFVKWDDTSYPSGSFDYRTKDIDFGQPGQRKKIYKVIVTYTTAASGNVASNVQVDYGVDGDTTFPYDFTVPELPAANGWQVAELVPDVSSESNNVKSIRLRFATDDTVPADFEINDVSIVYRLKPVR